MREQLQRLRELSKSLEVGPEQRASWTQVLTAHAEQFFTALPQGPAFRSHEDEGKGILSSPFTEEPQELEPLLKLLAEHVEQPGLRLGAPGFFGFIPISTLYPAALGDYLAAVTNPYVGNFFASPGAVRLEHLLTRWMAEFVGYPKSSAGDLTSGGSISNLSAILSAREAHGLKPRDYDRAVVYLTSQTHHSVTKALRIAGLGGCVQRLLPLDRAYRMETQGLMRTIREDKGNGLLPWLVVAAAGSTDTGAVDPLNDLASLCRDDKLWFHVDGAYGA